MTATLAVGRPGLFAVLLLQFLDGLLDAFDVADFGYSDILHKKTERSPHRYVNPKPQETSTVRKQLPPQGGQTSLSHQIKGDTCGFVPLKQGTFEMLGGSRQTDDLPNSS